MKVIDDLLDLFGQEVHFASPMTQTVRIVFARYHHLPHQRTWRPLTDTYETDDAIIVKVELAGMDPGDIAVSLSGRVLNIHGVRKCPCEKLNYQCMEIPYGEFDSNVQLTGTVDDAAVTAHYSNGFLLIRLPRSAEDGHVSTSE
jgi:HSP20 family protein